MSSTGCHVQCRPSRFLGGVDIRPLVHEHLIRPLCSASAPKGDDALNLYGFVVSIERRIVQRCPTAEIRRVNLCAVKEEILWTKAAERETREDCTKAL